MTTIKATDLMQKVQNGEYEILTDFFGTRKNYVEVETDIDTRNVEVFQVEEQTEETKKFFFPANSLEFNFEKNDKSMSYNPTLSAETDDCLFVIGYSLSDNEFFIEAQSERMEFGKEVEDKKFECFWCSSEGSSVTYSTKNIIDLISDFNRKFDQKVKPAQLNPLIEFVLEWAEMPA